MVKGKRSKVTEEMSNGKKLKVEGFLFSPFTFNLLPLTFSLCACLLFSVLLLLQAASASAGEAETRLTLVDAVKSALENNYEIGAFKSALGATDENIGVARSSLLPHLNFEERFTRTNNP